MSGSKRFGFGLALICICLAGVELMARVAYRMLLRKPFDRQLYETSMLSIAAPELPSARVAPTEVLGGRTDETLHPYFGYVHNPMEAGVSDYGFYDDGSPLTKRGTNALVVALLGGSFARGVYNYGQEVISESLKPFADKIQFVNFATDGNKQPQQLTILAYYLALGAQYDVVICLDGFNEIALPPTENLPGGAYPLFPRHWALRTEHIQDPGVIRKLARLDVLTDRMQAWAGGFARHRLYRSVFLCLVWRAEDNALRKQRVEVSRALTKLRSSPTADYIVTGPKFQQTADAELYPFLVAHWAQCSRLMQALCVANGCVYFHFLQPNQYVTDSKPMSAQERAVAINPNHAYAAAVVKGYPLLIAEGEALSRDLPFFDLTTLFTNNATELYADDCCHLSPEGYRLVAREMGQNVIRGLLAGKKGTGKD